MADDAQLQQQKRALVPYLDRAQEIEKVQPKVAYYCRLYAVEQVRRIKQLVPICARVQPGLANDLLNRA